MYNLSVRGDLNYNQQLLQSVIQSLEAPGANQKQKPAPAFAHPVHVAVEILKCEGKLDKSLGGQFVAEWRDLFAMVILFGYANEAVDYDGGVYKLHDEDFDPTLLTFLSSEFENAYMLNRVGSKVLEYKEIKTILHKPRVNMLTHEDVVLGIEHPHMLVCPAPDFYKRLKGANLSPPNYLDSVQDPITLGRVVWSYLHSSPYSQNEIMNHLLREFHTDLREEYNPRYCQADGIDDYDTLVAEEQPSTNL